MFLLNKSNIFDDKTDRLRLTAQALLYKADDETVQNYPSLNRVRL